MYKLVLLRHGESVWNRDNIFAGWTDVDLSDRGVEEAKEAARILKERGFVFDAAFTSVLKRAGDTLKIVLEEMGLENIPVEQSWRLNERHYGALQGVNRKEAVKKFGATQVRIWRRSYNVRPPSFAPAELRNGKPASVEQKENEPTCESLADVVGRVTPYWQEKISPAVLQGKRVLISAHGNSIRALAKILDQLSDREVEELNIPIGIPLVYELDASLKPLKHYYLADPERVEKAIEAVKDEIKI